MEITDFGGKRFAKNLILVILAHIGGANIKLLSTMTGLPKNIVTKLLFELEDQNYVRVGLSGKVWHVNEEMLLP